MGIPQRENPHLGGEMRKGFEEEAALGLGLRGKGFARRHEGVMVQKSKTSLPSASLPGPTGDLDHQVQGRGPWPGVAIPGTRMTTRS